MYQNTPKDKNARNAMSDFKSAKDDVKSDVNQLKSDARETYDDARDAVKGNRSLRALAHDAGERVQDFLNTKQDQVHDVRVSAERTIRANPLAVTAAAFAAGAIVARLFRRSN